MQTDDRHPELRKLPLPDIEARELPRPDMVTSVIQHEVRPSAAEQYKQWLQRIIPVAGRFPGHRGVNVIRPHAGAGSYTIAIRFDSLQRAEDWFQSEARRQLIAQCRSAARSGRGREHGHRAPYRLNRPQ